MNLMRVVGRMKGMKKMMKKIGIGELNFESQ